MTYPADHAFFQNIHHSTHCRHFWMPCRTRRRPAAPSLVSLGWVSTLLSWWPTVLTSTPALLSLVLLDTSGLLMGESNKRKCLFQTKRRKREISWVWFCLTAEQSMYVKISEISIAKIWPSDILCHCLHQLRSFWDRWSQWCSTGNKDRAAPQGWLQGVFLRRQS